MPGQTILDIPTEEQELMLKELRAARYGYLLGLHILLLSAAGRTPTEGADFLFCSRSSVYRTLKAYQTGQFAPCWTQDEQTTESAREPKLCRVGSARSSLCSSSRLRPSAGAARGGVVPRSACNWRRSEVIRSRARPSAAPCISWVMRGSGRATRHVMMIQSGSRALARIRYLVETLPRNAALFTASELDIHLLAKLGYEWMLRGTQKEVETPGKNEKNYLAGALNHVTGKLLHVVGEKKDRWLFIRLLEALGRACPVAKFTKIYIVVDNYKIHQAQAVLTWLLKHPRFELVYLPSYCPRANPIERAFGDVHDKCTRNHKRKRPRELVGDVVWHLLVNGPWRYGLSELYYTSEVSKAVAELQATRNLKAA